jgi:hypothetical protein
VDLTNSLTSAGGTLVITNDVLTYTAPVGFSGVDQFTYRLRGIYGGKDYARVQVRVGAGVDNGATVVSLVRESQTSVMVCLLGAANQAYLVEQSTNLITWTGVGPIIANAMGSMTYNYTIEPVEKRFYRFRKQ